MTYEQRVRERADALIARGHARILAIETSCDETAAAVVEDGRHVLSAVVASQIDRHALYGGVVPEIASRMHAEALPQVAARALAEAGLSPIPHSPFPSAEGRPAGGAAAPALDAVAVTAGPGLVGALLTGVSWAKSYAWALGLPLIGVNHIEGHVSANYLAHPELQPPFVCLIASGGHSHIVRVDRYGSCALLGRTTDDAAGEAFDKVARVLGLPYPGGPLLDALAEQGDDRAYRFPSARTEGPYDFSFSGPKTHVINLLHNLRQQGEPVNAADFAASFRRAVVDALVTKSVRAAADSGARALALAGGVASNRLLRRELQRAGEAAGLTVFMPPVRLCTDNAEMIGSAAFYRLMAGELAPLSLNALPSLAFGCGRMPGNGIAQPDR
ncbi:MAG: tRNA (adenosine(37)-N6)-threonylcarbamoyltransferase complex transferase subunit TsaD [Christensenellaceae bacterium]|nr:tRNA (adenosine(37)-N6)-threonylcarbamoyltransferase complex transferase subunit TsaD [Christensenellaceae bacterium]MEA5070223.1 tRNA (adenosine(37)-N6)-threonylcarbamoyltransferase complex transferase subunit TsaD [Christensenellaceae bacterium]